MDYSQEREQVAYFMRRLYRMGLTTTSGGNISCLTPEGKVAISASKLDKAELQAEGVGIVELDGTPVTEGLPLSIETGMHLAVYRKNPGVRAIVHAHPVTASAYCCVEEKLDTHLTAEAYALLGDPVFIPYALMGSAQLAENVADYMQGYVCGLMENHGVLAVGKTLLEAFDRLELLEGAAKLTLLTRQIGTPRALNEERMRELDRFVGRK